MGHKKCWKRLLKIGGVRLKRLEYISLKPVFWFLTILTCLAYGAFAALMSAFIRPHEHSYYDCKSCILSLTWHASSTSYDCFLKRSFTFAPCIPSMKYYAPLVKVDFFVSFLYLISLHLWPLLKVARRKCISIIKHFRGSQLWHPTEHAGCCPVIEGTSSSRRLCSQDYTRYHEHL